MDYEIEGMSCSACAHAVQSALEKHPSVKSAHVAYAAGRAHLEFFGEAPAAEALAQLVQEAGYGLRVSQGLSQSKAWLEAAERRNKALRKLAGQSLLALSLSLPLMVASMLFHGQAFVPWMGFLGAAAVLLLGRGYFMRAWQQIRSGHLAMDTLIALSTGIAFGFSVWEFFSGHAGMLFFESAALIMAFVIAGKYLEERARASSLQALGSLAELEVLWVRRHADGQSIPVEALKSGEAFRVARGERLATDGEVLEGKAEADEQWFTGESEPVLKEPGSLVLAGSYLVNGSLVVRATRQGAESSLNQTLAAVLRTLSQPAPSQRLADKISAVFVPIVLIFSLATLFFWGFWVENWSMAWQAALTVLAVACPCALGLATPTAISVAVGQAAKIGAVVQRPEILEWLGKTSRVYLDKTGTLTEGKPKVVDFNLELRYRAHVAWLAQHSVHPAAQAISHVLGTVSETEAPFLQPEEFPGKGLAMRDNKDTNGQWFLGKPEWAGAQGLPQTDGTMVVFGDGSQCLAWFVLESPLREGMPKAVQRLKRLGIQAVLLSGDREAVARKAAQNLGMNHYLAEQSPENKAAEVRLAKAQGHWVMMVGDGINDAEAMGEAQLSVAMQDGSGLALSAAGLRMPAKQLIHLPDLVLLGRKTRLTIRQNLMWAFLYNVLALPIAAGLLFPITGYLMQPMWAGLAMALSSVSVVANSLRLRFTFRTFGAP